MLNGKVYDVLKWISLTLFPASAVLIAALGAVWGWEVTLVGAVVATINAIGLFIGTLLGISSAQYYKNKEN